MSEYDYTVMLVDDDLGAAHLVMVAIADSPYRCRLQHFRDGVTAMNHLHSIVGNGRDIPDLVLLDLNMPRKNGFEVLADIRNDDILMDIPVVVLSTSDAEQDVTLAYRSGASGYVTKPIDIDDLFMAVKGIEDYWFRLVRRCRQRGR